MDPIQAAFALLALIERGAQAIEKLRRADTLTAQEQEVLDLAADQAEQRALETD